MPALLRFDGAAEHDPRLAAWLAALPAPVGDLAREWFARVRASGADVRELLHDGLATACVDDAPFAYVGAFTAHVNVGFFHGATLDDPARLLVGTGRSMRHVKLRPGAPLDDATHDALVALIAAAHRDVVERARSLSPMARSR